MNTVIKLCGCGQPAPIAKMTNSARGYIKGQPMRFVARHYKPDKSGPNHPRWKGGKFLDSNGYTLINLGGKNNVVLEHRMIAEKALGKKLPNKAVVHHHSKTELVICQNHGYHCYLHQRTRALSACGHANWESCWYCKTYDSPDNLTHDNRGDSFHKLCKHKYDVVYWKKEVTDERNINK